RVPPEPRGAPAAARRGAVRLLADVRPLAVLLQLGAAAPPARGVRRLLGRRQPARACLPAAVPAGRGAAGGGDDPAAAVPRAARVDRATRLARAGVLRAHRPRVPA